MSSVENQLVSSRGISIAERQAAQHEINQQLLGTSGYLAKGPELKTNGFVFDPNTDKLTAKDIALFEALQIKAARTAIKACETLAKNFGENDHLGGALGLISPLSVTMPIVNSDRQRLGFGIEIGHASLALWSVAAAQGHMDGEKLIKEFRAGLDFPGHVMMGPGGTDIGTGRLGVGIAFGAGLAHVKRCTWGNAANYFIHCGDAGWLSGQSLNGMNIAAMHGAPVTLLGDFNQIQLSGLTRDNAPRLDPRKVMDAIGVRVVEIDDMHDVGQVYGAINQIRTANLTDPRASLIFPTGYKTTFGNFAEQYGIGEQAQAFFKTNNIEARQKILVPGSIMGFRDFGMMLECVALTNGLPGGKAHHDGGVSGRKVTVEAILAATPMTLQPHHIAALNDDLPARTQEVITVARPAKGSPNLPITPEIIASGASLLPKISEAKKNPRAGAKAAYEVIAQNFPDACYFVDPDITPSTGVVAKDLKPGHVIKVGVQEQAGGLFANGIALGDPSKPQLTAFSTFAAFFDIAREMSGTFAHQRNLDGTIGGVNVLHHMSHVGSQIGRDHASGMKLDWIDYATNHLSDYDRAYFASDSTSSYLSVMDAASRYGAHLVCVPRDVIDTSNGNRVGLLHKQGEPTQPFYELDLGKFPSISTYRQYEDAKSAIIVVGAPSLLAGRAADSLSQNGTPTDVYIINHLPLDEHKMREIMSKYPDGVVTVADNKIGSPSVGLQGLAAVVNSNRPDGTRVAHIGINDAAVFPAGDGKEMWEYFGISQAGIESTVKDLAAVK